MKTRVLPVDEWPRLGGMPAWGEAPLPDPEHALIVVVEDDGGEILMHWVAVTFVHLECLWKRPDCGAGVTRALLETMFDELRSRDIAAVWTIAQTPEIDRLARHAGFERLPGAMYLKSLQ